MITDSIGNYLTKIRNAILANHRMVDIPSSGIKKEITKILKDQGYILNYKLIDEKPKSLIRIALKYDSITKKSAIKSLTRASKPGLRKYASCSDLPRVLNGLGVAIISTSKGVVTDKKARDLNVGGEVLCYIY